MPRSVHWQPNAKSKFYHLTEEMLDFQLNIAKLLPLFIISIQAKFKVNIMIRILLFLSYQLNVWLFFFLKGVQIKSVERQCSL